MMLAMAVVGALVLPSSVRLFGGSQDDLLYGEVARRWLDRNEVVSPAGWPELLQSRFVHLGLGVFDVFLPASSIRDPKAWKATGSALEALIDTQEGWKAWVAGNADVAPRREAIAKWLRRLTPKQFGNRVAEGADLAELAQAGEELRAELEQYRVEQRGGKALGAERTLEGVRLVIFPQRGEFVEFTCLAGSLEDRLRSTAWNAGLTTWLEYQAGDTRFLALEYCTTESVDRFDKGVSVGERNPVALSQLVAQVSSRALLGRLCSSEFDPALAGGLANALVIDLYGELDTRIDGDVRSRSSQGSSVFIPGGNPNGGALPATSAENRWRGTKGKDHFVGILSRVQKQSGKKAPTRPEKLTRFELVSEAGSEKEIVSAPFLGPKAVRPSAAVFPDYLELVRCYGVAFLHWLRIEGALKATDSGPLFGEFLRALAQGTRTEDLPHLLERIFAQPLSAGSADELFDGATLEGRFLTWLSKQS